ncbi:hypothetical protein TNCV_1526481 [Trichonephila clavipes]|nr:hypothetical protein TNCV_1526481 [Trichonephila clavipes]
MIQDYRNHRPAVFPLSAHVFRATAPPFSPRFHTSLICRCQILHSISCVSFDMLPGACSRSLHAPPKSKICPLWLILPFQTPGTENRETENS